MKQLLEDYKRRLANIHQKLSEGGNDLTILRLGTKATCYRTLISELEREINKNVIDNDNLPDFLYENDGEIITGVRGDYNVTKQWNDWLKNNM